MSKEYIQYFVMYNINTYNKIENLMLQFNANSMQIWMWIHAIPETHFAYKKDSKSLVKIF